MRGIFTAGVMDVLLQQHIAFDGCIGVSAGAAFGCNYKSQQPFRVLRYNLRFCGDKRYCSMRSLLKTGDLFGASFCYDEIPNRLDVFDKKAFNASPMPFYVVCTDAVTGKAVYHRCDTADQECFEWIRASASMPLVSRPVVIGNRTLLDGGIADSIPLRCMLENGYEKNVIVLTQPRDYVKEKASLLPLMRLSLRRYPKLIQAMAQRHNRYNVSRAFAFEQEQAGKALIICPKEKLPIGRVEHDPAVIRKVYRLGREAAEEQLDAIRRFLEA